PADQSPSAALLSISRSSLLTSRSESVLFQCQPHCCHSFFHSKLLKPAVGTSVDPKVEPADIPVRAVIAARALSHFIGSRLYLALKHRFLQAVFLFFCIF